MAIERDAKGQMVRTPATAGRPGVDADALYAAPVAAVETVPGPLSTPSPGPDHDPNAGPGTSTPVALKPGTPLRVAFDLPYAVAHNAHGYTLWGKLTSLEQKHASALVIALKSEGWGIGPIAKKTGLGKTIVERVLRHAREHEGLRDVLSDIDLECIPQAVDNMRRYLRNPTSDQGERATYKVLEGRGVLVAHQKTAGVTLASMTLDVTYTNAPTDPGPPTGQIAAVPRTD